MINRKQEQPSAELIRDPEYMQRLSARIGGVIVFRGARQVAVIKRNRNFLNLNKPYVAHFYNIYSKQVEKITLPDDNIDIGSL